MTFVKVEVALADLKVGERLDVLLTPGEPLENVPKSAEGEGNRIIEIREDAGITTWSSRNTAFSMRVAAAVVQCGTNRHNATG